VLAIQIDGPGAGDRRITLQWRLTDTRDEHSLTLQHGVVRHRRGAPARQAARSSASSPKTVAMASVVADPAITSPSAQPATDRP
jgi:alkyl sulfatase BDS1-like metallo-beta-lactamase superfamily hydrolase